MKPLDIAFKYMELFYSGKINELKNIFCDELIFEGPFYKFTTSKDYINSLVKDPPKNMKYEIIKTYEDGSSACLIYKLLKGGTTLPVAQMFEIKDKKICMIILIFDSKIITG